MTDETRELPVLPLRGMVPLPVPVTPLAVGRPASVAAVEAAREGPMELLLVGQAKADVETPLAEDLRRVGVLGRILNVLPGSDGEHLTVIVQATDRLRVHAIRPRGKYLVAEVSVVPVEAGASATEIEALQQTLRKLVRRMLKASPTGSPELASLMESVREPGALADLVATALEISGTEKQQILETFGVAERLRMVSRHVGHAIHVMELGRKLEKEVAGQLEEAKRQHLLREQLRAIRKELGEEDDPELVRLRKALEEADLGPDARTTFERELGRLSSMGSGAPERSWIVAYLDWIAALPWTRLSETRADLEEARRILDAQHFGLAKPKERILESLAVRQLRRGGGAEILCFLGAPGVGKTSLAQAVADATGRRMVRISVGGVSDESEIRGHRRTYVGAMPGRIISALRRAGTRNPVFVVDEIDKMASSFHGDPAAALLEVLDPEQNQAFVDRYIEIPFDLSRVLFIATANTTDTLPRPLLDRLEVIELSGYTAEEKLVIARNHLLPRGMLATGLSEGQVAMEDEALAAIIDGWTREAGVRSLERCIGTVLRKIALELASGRTGPWRIEVGELERYLGPRRHFQEGAERVVHPGIVMGLAWTPVGGEVLFIEAARMAGTGGLRLTGSIGNVMRESAEAALTWLRSHGRQYGDTHGSDFHIHVPAGATPKDGPSAGIAMLAALASAVSGRLARNDVAMTGEITLRGHILPVGGIREKILAAARAGVKTVILPRRNESDLEDVPKEIRARLDLRLVDEAESALEICLAR